VEDDSGSSSDEDVIVEESDDDIYFSAGEGEDSDELHISSRESERVPAIVSKIDPRGGSRPSSTPFLRGSFLIGSMGISKSNKEKIIRNEGYEVSNVVLASVEVDERRIGRPKGRRTLYAFMQHPPDIQETNYKMQKNDHHNSKITEGDDNSYDRVISNTSDTDNNRATRVRMCTLRTYKEWTSDMPTYEQYIKPFSHKRMNKIEQRRYC
jgi:hypothetical protein